MMVLAAAGDTWGISGPSFLGIFGLAFVVVFGLSLVLRRMAVPGRLAPYEINHEIHPYQAAALAGGRRRTTAAALAALYSAKVITTAPGGKLQVIAESGTPLAPLDDAIVRTLGLGMNVSLTTLPLDPSVRRALDDLDDGLVKAGLITGPGERTRARLAALPLALLFAVGAARVWAGLSNGKPVVLLVLAMIVVAGVWLGMVIITPRLTVSGRRALAAAKLRNRSLNPSKSPSWMTYGPTGAALGVALFGGAALVSLDPDFAEATEVQRALGSSSGSSGSFWFGSGTSCGSGSSSCGSGSSCGGGGGGGCGG